MKKSNRFKMATKNAILFGGFAVLCVGLGATGLAITTGALAVGISASALALGGIWGVVSGVSIKNAVEAKGAEPEEDAAPYTKKQINALYKQAKKSKKVAASSLKKDEKIAIKEVKADYKAHKKTYKSGEKKPVDKIALFDAKASKKIETSQIKSEQKAAIKALPKSPARYKLAKTCAVIGAIAGFAIAAVGSTMLFDHLNSADVKANESGTNQSEYVVEQTLKNNSVSLSIGGVALASAISGAVVAGKAGRRQKEALATYDYAGVVAKDEDEAE